MSFDLHKKQRILNLFLGHDLNDVVDAESLDRMAWEGGLNVVQKQVTKPKKTPKQPKQPVKKQPKSEVRDELQHVRDALNVANDIRDKMFHLNKEAERLLTEIFDAALS